MRKHVFPVCNPNVLEFKKENSSQSNLDGNIGRHFFETDGSWGQLLLGEANMEDWEVEGMIAGRGFFFIGLLIKGVGSAPNKFDSFSTSKPPSGMVICIGSKDKNNGTFDPFYSGSRCILYPATSYAFSEADAMSDSDFGNLSFYVIRNDQKSAEDYHAIPHWFTLMFDGTRWVFLGSNNWVS